MSTVDGRSYLMCVDNKIGAYTKNTTVIIVINYTNQRPHLTDTNDMFRYSREYFTGQSCRETNQALAHQITPL